MTKVLSLSQLKGLNGKTLFVNRNGRVVACRFTRLEVYLHGAKFLSDYADKFRYNLECADGSTFGEYHCSFPNVYYTADDCIKGTNGLRFAVVDEFKPIECILADTGCDTRRSFGPTLYRSPINVTCAYTYRRDTKTLKIDIVGIGQIRYDVLQDKFWEGCGPEYVEFVGYKTYEECAKNSPIEVVTF